MNIEYRPEDFTPHGIISADVIRHVVTTVGDFEPRYYLALGDIEFCGCGLDYADRDLWNDIVDAAFECFGFYEDEIPQCFFDDLEAVFG